ncbi:MAG: hypothetical protein AABY22_10360 [Nanoarchaeota archaeon]
MKFLVDENNTMNNEFFLLEKVFKELDDERKNDVVKLKLLIEKSREFYIYLKKIDANVKAIKGYKYIIGKSIPVLTEMSESDFEKETERNLSTFVDIESYKYNLHAWKDEYKTKLDKLKVYEVFFEAIMKLLAKIDSFSERFLEHDKLIQEKEEIVTGLTEEIKLMQEFLDKTKQEGKNETDEKTD